jgi:hypothetical protein
LGTQIIRELSPNWHINQLKNKIDSYPDDNFLIDDLRFPNELEFIKSVGGESWYIIRPSEYDLSNHESEIGVCWNDFGNNVIINNRSLRLFQKKWSQYLDEIINHPTLIHETHFLKSGIHTKEQLRTQLINKLKTSSTESVSQEIGCSRDKIVWWCDRLLVPISREEYYYDHTSFLFPTLEASYCAGILTSDGCIKLNPHKTCPRISLACMDFELVNTLKSFLKTNRPIYTRIHPISKKMIYELECGNSYVLQNLKWWNIKPRKSQKEEIPDIIKTNEECMKQWIVGLIDGDGSIFITKRGSLGLTILASREIIEFLEKFIPIKGSKRCNVKNTKLYELHWNNHKVVDVRNWLSPKIFLHRKWNKINEFISAGAENPRVFRPWDECDL